MVSLAPPGAIWVPLQGGGALGTPVGAIWAPLVPKGRPWAPFGHRFCSKFQLSRNQGFYTLYKLPNTPKPPRKLSQLKNTKLSQGFHHFLSIPTQIHLIPLQISHHSSLLLPFPLHFYHPPSPTSIFFHGSTLGRVWAFIYYEWLNILGYLVMRRWCKASWASQGSFSCFMLFHCIFGICGYYSSCILGRDMILSFYL